MLLHEKELLTGGKVTLTVITNPSNATCTLTYNGVSYNSKTATVKKNTSITYSITHSTYGTAIGTIVLDKSKTYTFTGTSSQSQTTVGWSQPALSSNGTLGSSQFAVASSNAQSSYPAWKAFDKDNSTFWSARTGKGYPQYLVIYSNIPILVTKFTITNRANSNTAYTGGNWYYSDSSSFSGSGTLFTNTNTTAGSTWDILTGIPRGVNSIYKRYWKLEFTSGNFGTNVGQSVAEVDITAYRLQSGYTYYWNVSVT